MDFAGAALEAFFFILWLCSVAFYVLSAWCVAGFFKRGSGTGGDAAAYMPPLTVLKPLSGADGDTYDNLKSFVLQDYPRCQVLFGAAGPDDPAVKVAESLVAEYPDRDISVVACGGRAWANRKVANLAGMYEVAKYDILVIADSDMRVGPRYLMEVAKGFDDASVGLVTCPYRGAYPEDVGAALEALTIDTDFLPSVAVAERLEGLSFALGATMAVRREALSAIGGFEALSDYLADDYRLGNMVGKAGYTLKLSGYIVDSVGRHETVKGYFLHQIRWGRTYRACRPKGYFLSVLTKGTAFSVSFLLASGFSAAGWWVLLLNLALRYAQALYVEAFFVKGPGVLRHLWLLPVKDLSSFVIWLLSFTGDEVDWKDARFRVDREGKMARIG